VTSKNVVSLGDLVASGALQLGDGYRTKRSEHGQRGYRIIRVADVMDDVVNLDGPDFVADAYAKAIGTKAGQAGDILLTTKGTVGRVAVMPDTDELVVYSPQLCFFRVLDYDAIIPRFLRYWFSSPEFWNQAVDRMNNTDMAAYINLADIRSLKLTLPDLDEQRAIAELLGALDDKIAANTKLAAIADEWVRTSQRGLITTAEETVPVSELVATRKELAEPSTLDPDSMYLGLEHLPRRSMWATAAGTAESVTSTKAKFQRGDILFGKLRPYFHKVVVAPYEGVCSTDILVLNPLNRELTGFALASVASDFVVERATAASEGTRMPRTSWKDLACIEIPWPGLTEAREFSARVAAVRSSAESLLTENLTLAATRDALLPQLMSGKLRVKDAEAVLEKAGV
jgi:type I restriction enzyme S subunit